MDRLLSARTTQVSTRDLERVRFYGTDENATGAMRSTHTATVIDLVFMVDCRRSTTNLTHTVRTELYNIMNSLAQELDFETANLAFVGYHDFYNKDDNYVVKNFMSNIS
ncbi:hypothetical protein HK098_007913 [Nowakowskiella sp. JEL0407]|nr:hypothetical protein HK098_007913 [Nowakowskiella sp. JEL0407]